MSASGRVATLRTVLFRDDEKTDAGGFEVWLDADERVERFEIEGEG